MRILLTGGSGQLGRRLRRTVGADQELFSPDSRELDLRERDSVRAALQRYEPELIINTAAYTQVDRAEADAREAFAVNARGVEFLARESSPQTRLIHISTDFVFDGEKRTPYLPSDPANPLSEYGRSKLAGEEALRELKRHDSLIIRTSWLYSPEGGNFVRTMLRLMKERPALSVVDDQRGTPTSTASLADAIWRFSERPDLSGVFHWSDEGEASWYEFAVKIQERALEAGLLEKRIPIHPIPSSEYPTPARRPRYSVLDKSATYRALDFEPADWEEALEAVLDSLRGT